MNVEQCRFVDLLGKPGVRFVIPLYQRIYTWSEVQCEELWLDIQRAATHDRSHFLGTILYSKETDDIDEHLSIIDGQQRMTSISLILLAFVRYLEKRPECGLDANELEDRYLRIAGEEGVDSLKLLPSHYDAGPYLAAIEGREPTARTAINRNLAYFEDRMVEEDFDPEKLIKGLRALSAIVVRVEDPTMAQSIFEGINSKGVPLNVADMIRNHLLLAESHDEQTRLYETYWKPSQEMFAPDPGSLRLNGAIKSWISIRLKGARILSAEQVYSSFKRFIEDSYRGEKEPVLRELRGFCLMWAENYRYHGTKKYKSGSDWAELGMPTLTSGYERKKADNEEYAERVRRELREVDSRW